MKKIFTSKLQLIRFSVQLLILTLVILGISTKMLSTWMLPAVLLLGVFFCGWICPLGTAQDWMYRLGRLLRLPQLQIPTALQQYLQLSRYIFYFLLTIGITFTMLKGPHHFNRLLHGSPLTWAAAIVILFLLLSLFIKRPFCNYFCTGGARMGLFSVLRIFSIRRDTQKCGHCGQCNKACPMNIDVANTDFVRHPNCIGCLSCISACKRKCLAYAPKKSAKSE